MNWLCPPRLQPPLSVLLPRVSHTYPSVSEILLLDYKYAKLGRQQATGIKHRELFTSLPLARWGYICLMNGRGQPSAQGFICHREQKTPECGDVKMTNSQMQPQWYFIASVSGGEGKVRRGGQLTGRAAKAEGSLQLRGWPRSKTKNKNKSTASHSEA